MLAARIDASWCYLAQYGHLNSYAYANLICDRVQVQ